MNQSFNGLPTNLCPHSILSKHLIVSIKSQKDTIPQLSDMISKQKHLTSSDEHL